jgi:hypothetical protein
MAAGHPSASTARALDVVIFIAALMLLSAPAGLALLTLR